MSSELVGQVVEIVARELRAPPGTVTSESTSADVEGWDSLGHLQVCMALEAEFDVALELDALAELDSVPAIVEFLTRSSR